MAFHRTIASLLFLLFCLDSVHSLKLRTKVSLQVQEDPVPVTPEEIKPYLQDPKKQFPDVPVSEPEVSSRPPAIRGRRPDRRENVFVKTLPIGGGIIPRRDPAGDEVFPGDAPAAPLSSNPPPLAPCGRWLHTATLIGDAMYVYSGLGKYSKQYLNDLWLYNAGEMVWTEMQSSFVPPFPASLASPTNRKPNPLDNFRPKDVPVPPPMKDSPDDPNGPVAMPLDPNKVVYPNAKPTKLPPMAIVDWNPLPAASMLKMPGYSFLEIESQMQDPLLPPPADDPQAAKKFSNVVVPGVGSGPTQVELPANRRLFNGISPNDTLVSGDLWKYSVDEGTWSLVKPNGATAPQPRYLHGAANCNGKLFVFGGTSFDNIILGDMWMFDPAGIAWTQVFPQPTPAKTLPLPREGHVMASWSNEVVIFGGISYAYEPFKDLWVYDSVGNKWTEIAVQAGDTTTEWPSARWMSTSTIVPVYGAVTPPPAGQPYKTPTATTGHLYMFGGLTSANVPLNDLWRFDMTAKAWQEVKPTTNYLPFPRVLASMAVIKQQLFMIGGGANNMALDDIWVFDLVTSSWSEETPIESFPAAREGATLVSIQPPDPLEAPQERPEASAKPAVPDNPFDPNLNRPSGGLGQRIDRYRKQFNTNRFLFYFGGSSPVNAGDLM